MDHRKPVIEFRNFGFQYKSQQEPTLYDINLTIYEGEKVLILGSSGSGKSTLASCVNGLIPFADEGTITGSVKVNGVETRERSVFELSKSVGTVLQDSDAQFVGLSVGEDIAFAMENDNMPRPQMVPRVKKFAGVVGMQDFLGAVPFNLSGGQKQKVAIAGVLGEAVNILIFDEPLAALDPQAGLETVEIIDELSRQENRTILIIEHRLEDVLHRHVDRIIFLSEGRILADTTSEALLRSSRLKEYGIREPLYLTAMKYAGCDLEAQPQISDFAGLELTAENRERLLRFFQEEVPPAPAPAGDPLLEFRDVTFAYEEKPVVENISFQVRRGERIAVIGKNGAGKSTAARLACGVIRPQKGQILLEGKDAAGLTVKELGEHIGYVMQDPNQMLIKDVIKSEVELALVLREYPKEERQRRASAALKACNLYPMRNWPVDAISYGQKKRVTTASMMALEPEILILDEPTAGQDYNSYSEIMEFVNNLNREYHTTILFITHDLHLAIEHTDRTIVFADGRVVADDSPFAVLADDDVIQTAHLKRTSLYELAEKLGLSPELVIRRFIDFERRERQTP